MLAEDTKIAMVGAGAIGGITAAFIQQAGHTLEIVCKHQDLADRIAGQGIHITGIKGEHRVKVKAVRTIADLSGPLDLVFLATKSTDCLAAARDLLPLLTPESMVVSLQNGICEHALARVLGKERVIGCVVGFNAIHHGPGELEVTSPGEFVIGNIEHIIDHRLPPIRRMLDAVQPTRISNNIMGELYSKLIVNSCVNSLAVIGGVRLGRLLAVQKVRTIFIAIMREAMAVAAALQIKVEPAGGGKLDFDAFLKGCGPLAGIKRHLTIRMLGFKYRNAKPSSLQSMERGRSTEIDFFNGYICDRGKELGVPTPVNDAVRAMVLEIEAHKRKMSLDNVDELLNVIRAGK